MEWLDIETAPRDGSVILAYRPLAHKTNDPIISIVKSVPYDNECWESTIPEGMKPDNYTDGYCKATHWMPLPAPPKE